MVVPNDGIGLIRTRHAIGPVILHVLPPASKAIQANDQGGHGRHAGHQVHRPVLPASPGSTLLLTGSMPGETLAAQVLRGSRQHHLPPVLVGQRVRVAQGVAWWASLCRILIVSILVVRGVCLRHSRLLLGVAGLAGGRICLASWSPWFSIRSRGIVFQVPSSCGCICRPLVDDPIRIGPGPKADRWRSQPVIGYWLLRLLLSRCFREGMPGDLFSESGHHYTSSSCSSMRGSILCSLPCCAHCCCLCCLASMYSLSTCWWRARRRPWCHCTCAIKVRIVFRLSGSCCRWSLPARSSQLSTCCHWSSAQSRSWTARLSQKTVLCQRARSRSWTAQVECWSAWVSQ